MSPKASSQGSTSKPISFDLGDEHRRAIESLAGGRKVRISGRVVGSRVVVDFVACNSPFLACNAAFNACNAAFNACNAAFNACNAAFKKE